MQKHLSIALFVLIFPVALSAQKNDISVFAASASYLSAAFTDPAMPGHDLKLDFDPGDGYGISYNRYWTPNVSTEVAYMDLTSEVKRGMSSGSEEMSNAKFGDATFRIFSGIVQWHFLGTSRLNPYAGAGVARVDGTLDRDDETSDLGDDTSYVACAGISFAATRQVSVGIDARYIGYSADNPYHSAESRTLDIDPLVIAAGIHFLF